MNLGKLCLWILLNDEEVRYIWWSDVWEDRIPESNWLELFVKILSIRELRIDKRVGKVIRDLNAAEMTSLIN